MKRQRREPNLRPKSASPVPVARPARVPFRAQVIGLFIVQLLLLGWAAAKNTHQLNTDAIAYLCIAEYWAQGPADLRVSGYWGPLLSWLMVPGIKLGLAPLIAARLVMAVSALVFSSGTMFLLRRLGLSGGLQLAGTAVCAIASIYWSVEYIAPDLLLAGLFCFAVGELAGKNWVEGNQGPLRAGVWWALAYLTKAVAFPLAFGVTLLLGALHLAARTANPRTVVRALGITLGAFALLAGPWVGVLSSKYGGFTFSTSGRINHAIVGPGNAQNIGKYHPFVRQFHIPDPARVTMWEDPSRMEYPYWSPFDGAEAMSHQVGLVRKNTQTVAILLANMDSFALGLLSLLALCVVKPPWRETLAAERWRWVLAPVICLGGIYTPVYVQVVDERYFYAWLPLLLASALGVVAWVTRRITERTPWPRLIAVGVVLISFAMVPFFRLLIAVEGMRNDAVQCAMIVAERLKSEQLTGPIAGSGLGPGVGFQRAGLYAAYFLQVPWYGDEVEPTADSFAGSGARLAIVPRTEGERVHPLAEAMARDDRFTDLDNRLFPGPGQAAALPVRVFEIRNQP